jgi:hypothetical protein
MTFISRDLQRDISLSLAKLNTWYPSRVQKPSANTYCIMPGYRIQVAPGRRCQPAEGKHPRHNEHSW